MTIGTLYQKHLGGRIDWRPGFLIQYAAAGMCSRIGALLFETRTVAGPRNSLFALAWLVFVLSFGAIWLLVFPDPPAGGGAGAEPVLSHAAGHRADGLCRLRRTARTAGAGRHGGLRRRRVPGELAHR